MRSLNQLSIKSKLILMLLAVSGFSTLVTAYLGYRSGQTNLTDRVFSQLTSVRASKAYQIESYFKTTRHHTQTLSENPAIVSAMQEFEAALKELDTVAVPPQAGGAIAQYYQEVLLARLDKVEEGTPILQSYTPQTTASRYLQYHYIAANPNPVGQKHRLTQATDGSDYSAIHARYHPIFRNIIEKFGYYDMFLIDPDGNIVYTVFKETDFISNLQTGPYKDSNLARLAERVQTSKERDYAWIEDFEPYTPSYGAPAVFIAAPIFDQSQLIGVLAFQLPVNEINAVMTGNQKWESDGLGETGETYLVGSDGLMRSVSRFLVQDPAGYADSLRAIGVKDDDIARIEQYGTSILQQQVETQAVDQALNGQIGTQIIDDYRGISVLSSYAPLEIEGLDWAVLAEIDLAEAYAPIYSFRRQILVSATLLLLLVTVLAMGLAHLFVRPIQKLIDSARKVATGELDTIAALETEDEFGELGQSFNAMVRSLRTQTNLVEQKNHENEQLLLSVFPAAIAKRLQRGEKNIAEDLSNVAVLFADLTGFAKLSAALSAYESVSILNDLIGAFDEAGDRYGMEKIKTIGDSYLTVCGLSVPYLDHDKRAIDFGLDLLGIVRRFNLERGFQLNVQIGINSGDVVAGIVGRNKVIYDVWGDTINLASALRDHAPPGGILVSEGVHQRLYDLYQFEPVGDLDANGSGKLPAWRLKSTRLPVDAEELTRP
ncbi:MAG: HAMP domain-containing protein [Tildeniella torsiva UHER 1998/13D]|nr:HAMP domain-containing protein [Tildeniella torsiva UHER 1998/13D]